MSSLEELMEKAKDLRADGHSSGQIADEMSLSVDTVTWLLTQSKTNTAVPKDVHIDWTTVSSNATLLGGMASMMSAYFDAETGGEEEIDTVVGISISGVPLATLIAAEEGLDLSIYHPSKHSAESGPGCISGNFSKVSGKRCILVDDVITSGNTLKELVAYLRRHNATPVAVLVIFDKRGMTEVDGVPVYSLFSIRLVD
ncbi:Orotate phosphoribosyltransferase [Methanocorpusculaceae archaeon Sp1]|uniref:Transcriptional regulator GfcR n=1 Tax=Methanorbis furvi TaxID=3028299 RepID=A0AAE4MFA8_9EURY|nr:Orotate phosphoribosyltransferase [Methanocorpusculaceae archaeon Sp1]MDV0442438.1 Orotate phosphoribosyltransferase [Methanocorpusculaceae archaeon Ag1]